jgi:hypothetical protein
MAMRVEHRVGIRADPDRIWDLVGDLTTWSRWNPIYPEAAGTIGIGQNLMLRESIPGLPERQISPRVVDWVPREQIIWRMTATRLLSSSLRYLEIEELAPGSCVFANGEIFSGVLGEQYARRWRRQLRAGFESLGEALRREAER